MKTKRSFFKLMGLSLVVLCVFGVGIADLLAEEDASAGEGAGSSQPAAQTVPAVAAAIPGPQTALPAEPLDPLAKGAGKVEADTSSETIVPGSQLVIRVLEQEELSGVYKVSPEGVLAFPLIREGINASGLTYNELAAKITDELKKNYFFNVTVIVARFEGQSLSSAYGSGEETAPKNSGGTVYVYGMARTTTAIMIPRDEVLTVSKSLIRCGGFGDFANKKKVKLFRKTALADKTETILVNVHEVLDKGKLDQDVVVQDGDIIVVTEKFWNF